MAANALDFASPGALPAGTILHMPTRCACACAEASASSPPSARPGVAGTRSALSPTSSSQGFASPTRSATPTGSPSGPLNSGLRRRDLRGRETLRRRPWRSHLGRHDDVLRRGGSTRSGSTSDTASGSATVPPPTRTPSNYQNRSRRRHSDHHQSTTSSSPSSQRLTSLPPWTSIRRPRGACASSPRCLPRCWRRPPPSYRPRRPVTHGPVRDRQ